MTFDLADLRDDAASVSEPCEICRDIATEQCQQCEGFFCESHINHPALDESLQRIADIATDGGHHGKVSD